MYNRLNSAISTSDIQTIRDQGVTKIIINAVFGHNNAATKSYG